MENFIMLTRVLVLAAAVLLTGVRAAHAQEAQAPRYAVGAHVTSLYFREFSTVLGRRSEIGVGGVFTMHVTNLFAVEAQADLYPKDKFFDDRRKIQGLFGVKTGVRNDRVGLFGKLRPGFIHVRNRLICLIPEGCGISEESHIGRFWFALDAGAVFEIYPSRRLALRVDAGDLFVRRFSSTDRSGNKRYYSSHNLHVGGGVALRF